MLRKCIFNFIFTLFVILLVPKQSFAHHLTYGKVEIDFLNNDEYSIRITVELPSYVLQILPPDFLSRYHSKSIVVPKHLWSDQIEIIKRYFLENVEIKFNEKSVLPSIELLDCSPEQVLSKWAIDNPMGNVILFKGKIPNNSSSFRISFPENMGDMLATFYNQSTGYISGQYILAGYTSKPFSLDRLSEQMFDPLLYIITSTKITNFPSFILFFPFRDIIYSLWSNYIYQY